MFDFIATEQADNAGQEALWTASRIAIEFNEAIQAKDADRVSEAYTQSARLHAGRPRRRLKLAMQARKGSRLSIVDQQTPRTRVTDDDIRAAGLDPAQWRDGEENLDECEETEDTSGAMPNELTYDCEADLGLTDDRAVSLIIASDVKEWRAHCKSSQEDAAKKLGKSSRALRDYKNGKTEVPRVAALAMWALAIK